MSGKVSLMSFGTRFDIMDSNFSEEVSRMEVNLASVVGVAQIFFAFTQVSQSHTTFDFVPSQITSMSEFSTRPVDPFPAGGTFNGRGVIIFDHLLTVSTFDSRLGVKRGRSQGRSHCNMKLFNTGCNSTCVTPLRFQLSSG